MNGWYALAERQYGVVTRAQLRGFVTDRQIDTLLARQLTPLYRGVFRVAGSYPSARQRAMAAVLHCGDEALLSHSTAAELLRLPATHDERFHLAVPPSVKRATDTLVLHRTASLLQADRYVVDGLPCTSPTRTIIDLAGQVEGEALEHAFDAARRMGLTTTLAIERRIGADRTPSALRDLLHGVDARPKESRLEVRVARLLRKHQIVPEATQHAVPPYRIDFVLSLARQLGLECDGFEWHGNRLAWKRDRRRIAALEVAGWRLTHVTWDDVCDRPAETIERIRKLVS
jgi:very-short-patch-repair endonuclease